jgi:hypothetical protein
MKKRLMFALLTVALALVMIPAAQATEARSQSLLYNLAFEDQTDVFTFPNLLPEYTGLYFHMPPAATNVYGGMVIELGSGALGVFIHRPYVGMFDQYRIALTDGDGTPVGLLRGNAAAAAEPHIPGQMFDVMYGAKSWGIGLRTHIWSDVSDQQGLADPPDPNATITFEANGGFRLSPGFDLHTNIGFRETKDVGFTLRGLIGTRYMTPKMSNSKTRTVFGGEVQFGIFAPKDGDSSFGFTVPVKGGVNYAVIKDVLTIGLLGGIDLQMLKPGGGDTKFGLGLPTIEIAAEWYPTDWMDVRTAIKGGYGFQLAGAAGDTKDKKEQMAFSTGMGFLYGPFRMDAVVAYSLWQSGPYFIGGTPGLFGGVTLSYLWGDNLDRSNRHVPEAEEAVAKPAAKPVTEADKVDKVRENAAKNPAPAAGEQPKFEGWEENQ